MSNTTFTAGSSEEIILDHMDDAAFVVDDEWKLVYANAAALTAADATLDTLRGQSMLALADDFAATEADADRFEATLESVFAGGGPERVELELALPTGRVVGEYSLTPISEDGTVVGATVIAREIAELDRRRTELDSIQSVLEHLYRAAGESRPFEEKLRDILAVGCEFMGVEQGFLTDISDGTQRIVVGAGPNEQLQRGETAPVSESYCRHTIESESSPYTVVRAREEGWESDPAYELFGLGCYVGSTVLVDGEQYGTLCFADRNPRERAFTETQETFVELLTQWVQYELERRQREQQLKRQNELFEKAQDIGDIGGWEYNLKTEENWFSAEATRIYGLSPDESITPEEGLSYYHPGDRQTVRDAFEGAIEDGQSYDIEVRFVDAEGTPMWVRTRGEPRYDDGDVVAVQGTIQDITDRKENEQKLQGLTARLEGLFDRSPDMVDVHDADGRITDVNERMCEELGYSAEELVGKPIWEVDQQADPERVAEMWEQMETGDRRRFEGVYQRADGSTFPAEVHLVRLDLAGTDRFLVISRDITDQKRRERELTQSRERLAVALEGADAGVWEWDPEQDDVHWHESCERLFGLDPGTFEGTYEAFRRRVHEDDIDELESTLETAVDNRDPFDAEFRIRRDDGDVRWMTTRGHFVIAEESPRYIGVITDVTELKEREEELRVKTRAIESAPVGITISDPSKTDNPIVYANEAYTEITGYSKSEATGQNCRYLQGEETAPDPVAEMRAAIDEARPVSVELLNYRNDGSAFWNEVTIAPVEDDTGTVTNFVGFQRDVTERKRRERDLQQFAYAASHDLREPLRVISNYLQLLDRRYGDDLDEDATEYVDYAVDAAERMKALIQGLLTYSRIDTRGEAFEPVNLDAVVSDALANLEIAIQQTDATVEVADLPTVEGDADQLVTVFQNLLDNAITYAGEEPPDIDVSVTDQGRTWVVTVADEGIGVDPDHTERAFELFERFHGDDTDGTGIGLALCERIVDRHGGTIWMNSEPGEGTAVHISLPKPDDHQP